MRIATWNINGLAARLDFLLHWLDARGPDIVGLQELKTADEKFPHERLAEAGYHAAVHGQKAWNGVAVLARTQPEIEQAGLPGREDMGARLVTARVGDLRFTSVYVPNGKTVAHPDFAAKLAWLDTLADHVEKSPSSVLCGDFNVCPGPLDSWNEELHAGSIFHTDEERARFSRLVDGGLVDIFRALHPQSQLFSWWDYRAGAFHKNRGLRIDFLLAAPAVAERVRSVEIDRDYRKKKDGLIASDHCPVIADLD